MKSFLSLFLVLLLLPCMLQAQQPVNLQGTVREAGSGEALTGVTIKVKGATVGAVSDIDGRFSFTTYLKLPLVLQFSMIGYQVKELKVSTAEQLLSVSLEETTEELAEVVVSASRIPETIDETPSSVTILPEKMLKESMLVTTNVIDILSNQVPGLAPSTGTSSNWGQTLRGRPMLIMIDGVPQSTPLRNGAMDMRALDPAVIERVEVIKGATAVYGNGAAGGLINYITKTPRKLDPFSSQTTLGMGGSLANFDNSMGARLSQQFWGKIDDFDYVVSGIYEQSGEWKDAEGDVLPPTYGLGETDSYNGFIKLGYNFSPEHRVQASYNFYSSEQKTNYIAEGGDYETRQKRSARLGEPEGVPQGVRANHNVNLLFEGKGLPLNTSYSADAYFQSVDNVFFWSADFVAGGQSRILSNKKGLRFVLNTPLVENGLIEGDISYGLDLLNDVTSQPLVDGRIWVPEMNMNNLAPFAQLKLSMFEDLVLKGGFRMEKVNIGVEDYHTLPVIKNGEVIPSMAVEGGELKYDAYLWNAGLRYNRFALFQPYASFSQGFSVADVGVMLRSANVDSIQKINTEAVLINNYEAGFVSKWKGLRVEGVGYFSTSKLGTSGKFKNGVYQVDRSPERIWGYEVAADLQLAKSLYLGGSYSWVEGKKQKKDDDDNLIPGEWQYMGGDRISAPKVSGYISYSLFEEKLGLRLQYTGIMNRHRFTRTIEKKDPANPDEPGKMLYAPYEGPVEAYNLFNLSASYKVSESTTLGLGVENMLNEDYFPARSQWFTLPFYYTKGKGAAFNLSATINL